MEVSGQLYTAAALPPRKGLLVTRAVLDAVVKRKIPSPSRELNAINPIASP
jgi:hypothetical protein